ncbi:MAG: hypothetical protein K0R72_301 [Clostridia bacterium]|jgi:hypothetical protein|nr:hypothetical protein [Clostridia bacterium]
MIENKVGSNKKTSSKLYKNNINVENSNRHGKKSNREKIMIMEKRSIMINNIKILFKKNFLKLSILFLALLVILIYTNSNKKISIDEYSNISELNASKYSSEIVNLYNRDGQLDLFLAEMNRVQSLVGIYLISNSTLKENSFSNLIKDLNKEINNDNWLKLDSEKSKYYNGKYTIDDTGNLKFKFGNKNMEPNWINNDNISRYVILN